TRPAEPRSRIRLGRSLALPFSPRFARGDSDPQSATAERPPAYLFLAGGAAVFGIALLAHLYFNLLAPVATRVNFRPPGRYLFAALVPLLALLVVGLDRLLRAGGAERWLVALCAAVAASANAWALAVIRAAPWARVTWTP